MKFIDIYFKWVKITYCYSGIEKILHEICHIEHSIPFSYN